jgi:hypothetical protein
VINLQYEDQNKPVPYPEVRRALPGLNSGTSATQEKLVPRGMLYHTEELVPLSVYPIPLGSPRKCAHKAARGALAKPGVAEDELRTCQAETSRQKKI